MKRLYLLRHAKSSWKDPGLADHDRPLAGRGRRAAKASHDTCASWASSPSS
jgi:phosphohistidine phosphatase